MSKKRHARLNIYKLILYFFKFIKKYKNFGFTRVM